MNIEIKRWENEEEVEFLKKIGIKSDYYVLDFGSSDCNCGSHLFKIRNTKIF